MKIFIDQEWLNQRLVNDDGDACEAGKPICRAVDFVDAITDANTTSIEAQKEEQKPSVLSLLVHRIRRRDRLTLAQFADRIRVSVDELSHIENNPLFGPQPRTLHQLADYSKIPPASLLRLVPDAIAQDHEIENAALKFAASSDDLADLSRIERRELNDFVKFLASYKGKTKADAR